MSSHAREFWRTVALSIAFFLIWLAMREATDEIERLRRELLISYSDHCAENDRLRAEIDRLRVEVVALRAQHEGARDLDEWLAKHPEYAKAASTSRE